jgi:hypothetical protein
VTDPSETLVVDERWRHGMNGWRCRFATGWFIDGAASEYGEITGFDHPNVVWVVLDGEDEPRQVFWHALRPA